MSDRPTLETDNIARGNHVVPTEWAQQLERERDEARRKLDVTAIHSCHNECQRPICVLRRERDEAREDRENSRQSLAFALEELDEARKEAHRFRALHYSHLGINASASWFPWEEKLGHE
mgnify:FL=1